MSAIDLRTLLMLVGDLVDGAGPQSPSTRFRAYLQENVQSVGELRPYVETALSTRGEQYNKALQDLVNHIGALLGFTVEYGRYRGVRGQIGFDGLWQSPSGSTVVIEVKTTDVYSVKTATLLGYINDLVSAKRLKRPDQAVGLYVFGRFDADTNQLEKAITAERRQDQLRVISVDALLNLLELQQNYDLDHQTILQLLLPSSVQVDPIVNLIFDIVSEERRGEGLRKPEGKGEVEKGKRRDKAEEKGEVTYYLLPAADSEDGMPVLENLHHWLDRGLWGLGQRTGHRKFFRPGDRFCFYAARIGVVAECTVASASFDLSRKESPKPDLKVPYGIRLQDVRWFEDAPVAMTAEVRTALDAFQERDPTRGWAWFVQGTSKLTPEDFELLTGKRTP